MTIVPEYLLALLLACQTLGHPTKPSPLSDPSYGPQPGYSKVFSDYRGKKAPFPVNVTSDAILPTRNGKPGADDLLFQNLLSAEWTIFSFYQQGVEAFSKEDFVKAGFPNTTYDRIAEIRDNEAGHLRIFQDQISASSVKPGACKYEYGFKDATSFLALSTELEISSMAFLTGLILEATLPVSKSALVAIAETESRHNAWGLIDIWNTDPFGGPTDTIYPYANQILDLTRAFIVPSSCPKGNPTYPKPNQDLPTLSYDSKVSNARPGAHMQFTFPDATNQPVFDEKKDYYVVAFHALANTTVPFDVKTNRSTIPADIEPHKGVVMLVIAEEKGAPTLDSVVAGPLIAVQQPGFLSGKFGEIKG